MRLLMITRKANLRSFCLFYRKRCFSCFLLLLEGEGEASPAFFFENRKKCLNFWKKGPNCVNPWVESSTQNVVLRVSRRKSSKIFLGGPFFFVVLTKSLLKCSNSTKSLLPWKVSGCARVLNNNFNEHIDGVANMISFSACTS